MSTICHADGIWDAIRQAPYLSRQEWQAANLLILCQLLVNNGIVPSMSSCTVDGLWNQIRGNPPFLSDQEFYAENINLLCQLLAGGGTGGSGSVLRGEGPPIGDNPGTPTKQYTDELTGIQYTEVSPGVWE